MTYSDSRAHYAENINAVVDDREEVVIPRAGHEPVVIVALADYESLKETAYLLRSPENARRLLASIDRLEHDGGLERDLLGGSLSGTSPRGRTTSGGGLKIARS